MENVCARGISCQIEDTMMFSRSLISGNPTKQVIKSHHSTHTGSENLQNTPENDTIYSIFNQNGYRFC